MAEAATLLESNLRWWREARPDVFGPGGRLSMDPCLELLYNIHFSLLPKYRGVYTSLWPIWNGEAESGVTLHLMDPGVDTGAIISQRRFQLESHLMAEQLYERYHAEAFELFKEQLPALVHGRYGATPQDQSLATAHTRKELDLGRVRQIDLTTTAEFIDRQVRALYFPVYQTATLDGRGVRACNLVSSTGYEHVPAGTLIANGPISGLYVVGGGQAVELVWA